MYQPRINPIQPTTYPKARRTSGFQLVTRRTFAILAAAGAAACFGALVVPGSSKASQGTPPITLKIWDGASKPAFSLDDLRGDRRDLQALAGKVILVHFFATWCEPCVREITSLQRLATAARDKPLAIIAVDVAEVDLRVRAFFEKLPVRFTVLLDRDRAVSKAWDITALPTSFVLDATLSPRFYIEGDLDWSSPKVLAAIEPLYPTADRRNRPLPRQADKWPDRS
jgi:thiol-disulfide isomerase/thioredoxin